MSDDANTQNSEKSPYNGAPLEQYKWQPGQSGNPGGRPKKKPITDLYEEILGDPEAMEMLKQSIVKSLAKGQMAMVLQLREMTDRVEGKVSQPVDLNGELAITTLSERMRKARDRANG